MARYTVKQLEDMVMSDNWVERWAAAEYGFGLARLANDPDWFIRATVAQLGYKPEMFLDDEDPRVRRILANKGYGLETLVNDPHWAVRKAVAEQGYGLETLKNDDNWLVCEAALKQLDELGDCGVEISVGTIVPGEGDYLEGTVAVNGTVYPFDYNLKTEAVEVHCYSEPGWITGASYEKPLPEIVTQNMEDVLGAIEDAVHEFLSVEELKKEQAQVSVDAVLQDAAQRSCDWDKSKAEDKGFEDLGI